MLTTTLLGVYIWLLKLDESEELGNKRVGYTAQIRVRLLITYRATHPLHRLDSRSMHTISISANLTEPALPCWWLTQVRLKIYKYHRGRSLSHRWDLLYLCMTWTQCYITRFWERSKKPWGLQHLNYWFPLPSGRTGCSANRRLGMQLVWHWDAPRT